MKASAKGLIEAFWDRLHEDCANHHFRNLNRYCVLKSGVEVRTPCKFCIFPKMAAAAHSCFTHKIVISKLSCFITMFQLLPWDAVGQEYWSVPLNSRNIRQQLGGGLCKFLCGPCPAMPPRPAFRELIHGKRPPSDLPITHRPSWSLHPWFCFLEPNLVETVNWNLMKAHEKNDVFGPIQ